MIAKSRRSVPKQMRNILQSCRYNYRLQVGIEKKKGTREKRALVAIADCKITPELASTRRTFLVST